MTRTGPHPHPIRVPATLSEAEAGALEGLADVAEGIPGLSRVMTALNKVRREHLMADRVRQAASLADSTGRDAGARVERRSRSLPSEGVAVEFTESEAAVLAEFAGPVSGIRGMGRAARILAEVGRLLAEARAAHEVEHARRVARYTGGRTRSRSRSDSPGEGAVAAEPDHGPRPSR